MMWFHLLIVSAFVALGSCREFGKADRNITTCLNPGQHCSCTCNLNFCPPCPIPVPAPCLEACGDSLCPCPSPRDLKRANLNRRPPPVSLKTATSISTVNVYPSGPVCSAFHILPHLVVTSSSCIAGKNKRELFVTVNEATDNASVYEHEPLKVEKIEVYPYATTYSEPIVLVLKHPKFKVDYLSLPPVPADTSLTGEIHKWYINDGGRRYLRFRSKVQSFAPCKNPVGRDQICANTKGVTRMGWNDIGTPFVVNNKGNLVVHGIYMGKNLYEENKKVEYLSLYPYGPWLYNMVEQYN